MPVLSFLEVCLDRLTSKFKSKTQCLSFCFLSGRLRGKLNQEPENDKRGEDRFQPFELAHPRQPAALAHYTLALF